MRSKEICQEGIAFPPGESYTFWQYLFVSHQSPVSKKLPPGWTLPGSAKNNEMKKTYFKYVFFHFIDLANCLKYPTTTITTVLVMVVWGFLHKVTGAPCGGNWHWWLMRRQRDMPGRYSFSSPEEKLYLPERHISLSPHQSPVPGNRPDELYPGLLKIMKWKKTYFKYVFLSLFLAELTVHHNHNNCPCYGCVRFPPQGDWCPLWRKLALVTDEETKRYARKV